MSETPRTDAHVRQLADSLCHPHWIEFAKDLERENRLLRAKFNVTKDSYEFYKSEAIDLANDKAMLDFLLTFHGSQWFGLELQAKGEITRKAIYCRIQTEVKP